jgi:hyperosmotically inducible periplasmic protein
MKRTFWTASALALMYALAGCTSTPTEKPASEVVDDAAITGKVKTALTDDETTKARDIKVETYKGVVQLSGFVDSNAEKQRAGEVARAVGGVKEVRNDIEVQTRTAERSTGEVVDDGVITAKVKAALIDDPVTKARQINVDTRQGVVQLQGFVDTNDEKMKATEVARSVSGVQSVLNDLEVKPSSK